MCGNAQLSLCNPFLILIWCMLALKCAYHVLQHIYHTNSDDHLDANEQRLFWNVSKSPAPSHYTGFLNHLVWICIYSLLGKYSTAQKYQYLCVCVHYSFTVTYLDTHAFSWRQTEWQTIFHLRRLAVCKQKIHPLCPCVLYFFASPLCAAFFL